MKMTIYEIGANLLKISNSSKTKANHFFEETEKIPYQHGLGIHDESFLIETINEIGQIHHELSVPGKLVIILPNFITTSRTINLPVSARNKINMMIPFQLDESLPSGSQAMHWVEHIYKIDKNSSNICLSLINKELFQKVFQQLKAIDLYPFLITSELSIYIHLIDVFKKPKLQNPPISNSLANSNFVILDMGELQTKAYFFSGGQLVFNHYSNIGSHNIDENIADNYELSLHEAKVFKEENGFLFSDEDYKNADKDQVIFAKLMEKTLEPMLLDFAKWDLAFRSKTSSELEKCFIVGGMSKMNNIENFLTEQLEVNTDCLDMNCFSGSREYTEYFTHQALNFIDDQSMKPGNFLKDEFKLSNGSSGLAENTAFFTNRSFILSIIVIIFLSVERVFLEIDKENANKNFKKALNSKSLNLGKREQVSYRKKHKKLKQLIKPRLEKIDDNTDIISNNIELPINMLYEHIQDIELVKGVKVSKLSLYEKSISSELELAKATNIDETINNLKNKFGNKMKDLGEGKFEIFIRK